MKRLNQILTEIARKHLSIPALQRKNSDKLDFHDVSVWAVQDALKAAFDAGANARRIPTGLATTGQVCQFDDYEIHGVKRFNVPGQEEEPAGNVIGHFEQVADKEAEFWSPFGHIPGQGLECVGDFETRELAEEIYIRITGKSYGH